jgi:uroporphyrin-III C-methyltransferase/precorrin-2 dehydrogenase/sirohydrochlorin ferrochelatase
MTGLPLLLDVVGRRVLVVGGGSVALRRVHSLLDVQAAVDVVAVEVSELLAELPVSLAHRRFLASDVDGAWLVFACTDDPAVNEAVAEAAAARGIFCVRAGRRRH